MRIQMATKSSKKYKGVYCDNKGKIFYQIDLGIDPVTGKRVQKKARKNQYGKTFETMKEAYDELVRIKYEFANKVSLENYNMTFENYMNKIYLRAYKQKVQSVTYKTALPHHKLFIQYFGLKPLKAITPRDCEAFRLHIIENYSENYAKNLWSRFKACMGYAERLGYISNMPCKALDNPRGKHPETPFWTYAEFQTFIKSFDLHDYEELQRFTAIWLYYMTGVRVSEGLSLCWEDIDFDKKFLKVHTTLEKDENGNWYRKDQTKTPAGERLIELDDITIEVLQVWRKNQFANQDTDFIISRFGDPFCKSTICRIIKRKAQQVGVPVITGKGLRHSHASYLINVFKKDILYVARRMGHADKSTTLNTYSHWFNALDKTVSEEITQNIKSAGLDSILCQNSCQTSN